MNRTDVVERITQYLSAGGLFNPEMMDHSKVSELLIDCRDRIAELEAEVAKLREGKSDDSTRILYLLKKELHDAVGMSFGTPIPFEELEAILDKYDAMEVNHG